MKLSTPLVTQLARRPGQKEARYAHLLAGEQGGTLRMWEVSSGKEQRHLAGPFELIGLAVAPEGKTVAAVAFHSNAVRLWDTATGKEQLAHAGHQGMVRPIRIAQDGKMLLSASRDRSLRRWDLAAARELRVLRGSYAFDFAVSFSADGKLTADEGTVTPAFLTRVREVAAANGVSRGVVSGFAHGEFIRLRFSKDVPEPARQQLRNWWASSGWSAPKALNAERCG